MPSLPSPFPWMLVLCCAASLCPAQQPSPRRNDIIAAVESGDTGRVRQLLGTEKPDAVNDKGETPLMLAARAGNFEICRALLWSGADANRKDKAGKRARDHLSRTAAGFTAVNLLLRCYAFVQEHSSPPVKPARPRMVLVSDDYIDHDHPRLKGSYWVNEAERTGRAGKDDDGNGFVDDVYGWNPETDEPLRAPVMADMANELDARLLKKFMTLYNRDQGLEDPNADPAWKDLTLDDLEREYENPLVRQIGFESLRSAGLDLNDKTFARLLAGASHGTHVAGIALEASENRALLHGMTHGHFHTPRQAVSEMVKVAAELAPRTLSYEQFLLRLRQQLLDEAIAHGKRRSSYLRSVGAGVVNMSWTQKKSAFIAGADRIKGIYELRGMDPASIETYVCPPGLDLCSDLGFELLVATAAEFALMIHENPDVLFVIAAGNDGEDNDEQMPSPAYLSRFFPNVITVGSVDDAGGRSRFSNWGAASVQITAPGEDIISTFLAGQEGLKSGTSMAAPAVAGLAARIRAEHPALTAADVRLILERSAERKEALSDILVSGGVADPQAALDLAACWSPGARADLTLAAMAAPSQKPEPEEVVEHFPGVIETGADDKGARIKAIGGFAEQWRIVMEPGAGATRQCVHPRGVLPIEWVRKKWSEGWEVTSIGGEKDLWRVVMSKGDKPARQQKLAGHDFDATSLSQLIGAGYRITCHAGYLSHWTFVLTADTGWGEQAFTPPGSFDDKRRSWIAARMKEGYRITSIGGDDNAKNRSYDTWIVVMTRDAGLGEQVFTGPSAWPEQWIKEHETKGYLITQCSGFDDHWVVVMTKSGQPSGTVVSEPGPWNDGWITKLWRSPVP